MKQLNKIKEFSKNNKGLKYPLKYHALKEKDDYDKNYYIKMMCMVGGHNGSMTYNQILFIQRIISCVSAEHKINEYVRMAFEVDVEDYAEFFNAVLIDNCITESFVVDIAVLCYMETVDADYNECLAEIIGSLGLTDTMIKNAFTYAKFILEQDISGYFEKVSIPMVNNYSSYFSNTETDDSITVFSGDKGEFSTTAYENHKNKKITLFDLKLTAKEDYVFVDFKELKFTNCKFSKQTFKFENCDSVSFIDCSFEDYNDTTYAHIIEVNNSTLKFTNSKFKNCKCGESSNNNIRGGLIHDKNAGKSSNGVNKLELINTEFSDCSYNNLYSNSSFFYCISNCIATVTDCSFVDCKCTNHLFTNNSIDNGGNRFENSTSFKYERESALNKRWHNTRYPSRPQFCS